MERVKKSIFFKLKISGLIIMCASALIVLVSAFLLDNFYFSIFGYVLFCLAPVFICISTLIESKKNGDSKGFKFGVIVSIILYVATMVNIILLFVYQPIFFDSADIFDSLNKFISTSVSYRSYLSRATDYVNILSVLNAVHAVIFAGQFILFAVYAFLYSTKKYNNIAQ